MPANEPRPTPNIPASERPPLPPPPPPKKPQRIVVEHRHIGEPLPEPSDDDIDRIMRNVVNSELLEAEQVIKRLTAELTKARDETERFRKLLTEAHASCRRVKAKSKSGFFMRYINQFAAERDEARAAARWLLSRVTWQTTLDEAPRRYPWLAESGTRDGEEAVDE